MLWYVVYDRLQIGCRLIYLVFVWITPVVLNLHNGSRERFPNASRFVDNRSRGCSWLDRVLMLEIIRHMTKRNAAGKKHSLKDARHPVLVRQSGERLVAPSEFGQLQDKREHLIA